MILLVDISGMNKLGVTLVFSALFLFACNKPIVVDPPGNTVNEQNVFKTDATAIAVLNGIYSGMIGNGGGTIFNGSQSITLLAGLSADELTLYSAVADNKLTAYYKNALSAATTLGNYGSEFWAGSGGNGLYSYIFICNAAIEGLNKSATLTPSVKQQLAGEAKFLRAFFYFYLVNLYGDVPLALSTDPKVNATLPRTPKAQVYQQIINDLMDAQNLLSSNFLNGSLVAYQGSSERVRPTKWAATALLARVYLYTSAYSNAETQASLVINQASLFSLSSLNNVFLKNSSEAIWQIQPIATGRNVEDGFTFILPSSGPNGNSNPVYLSNQLFNSLETGDQRKTAWTGSVAPGTITYYFPYKYKSTIASGSATEYLMMLRLAEQYLIRAEARGQQNNISGAQADLNVIRNRAGLPNTTAATQSDLLSAILHERQVELFTELGQRWLDLKRTNNVDNVMRVVTPLKGGTWNSNWQLYPVPVSDIQKNPALVQNSGY
jgi:hypothetical protein